MRLPAQPTLSLCPSGPISPQKHGVLLRLSGVFFGGVYFTFCFETAAEMSFPHPTAPPCKALGCPLLPQPSSWPCSALPCPLTARFSCSCYLLRALPHPRQ